MKNVDVFYGLPFSEKTVIDDDGDILTISDKSLASDMLSGSVSTNSESLVSKVVSVRLDSFLLDFLDLIVERSGGRFTRNALIVQLLRAGLASAWSDMSENDRESLLSAVSSRSVSVEVPDI